MQRLLILLALLAPAAQAGVLINSPYWVIALDCPNNPRCYASSNAGYTGSLNGARRFDDPAQAGKFMNSLTSSLRGKSPRIEQHGEQRCVEPSSDRPIDGRPC
ncbi:MAG: hypothetical protein OZ926_07645 [Pseudomonas sp.]|nr:hypothetical protein [Pseudomonas sp.]